MTRTSTASSSTEPAAATEERQAAERATRRQFFRLFGRQTVTGAGNVLAGVAALRQSGQEALDELLAREAANGTEPSPTRPTLSHDARPPAQPAPAALRSPFRVEGGALAILDQRALPDAVVTIACRDVSEVASAIRAGLLGAGPVLGQVAAYAIALAVEAAADRPTYARHSALRTAADTLRAARPINRALVLAVDRVAAATESAPDAPAAARAEAELIAMEAALDHAALGRRGADIIGAATEGADLPLQLLMVGDLGPLAGGMVGPGFALIQALAARDLPVHVWLPDGAPLLEGRRAAWQLAELGVPHTQLPDAAIGWLLANRRIDAVLVRAEWACVKGGVVAALGASLAARAAHDAGVPVYVVAPAATIDPTTPDASSVASELRMPTPESGGSRLDPAADVLPAALLSGTISAMPVSV